MKKILFLLSLVLSFTAFADNAVPETVRMAVFPDNTVFSVKKAVFPDGKNEVSFFDDTNFFKGSFSIWQNGIDISVKEMPKKTFSANVLHDPNSAFAGQNVVILLKDDESVSGKLIRIENPDDKYFVSPVVAVESKNSKRTTYVKVSDIAQIRADKADLMSASVPASCRIFRRKDTKGELPFSFSYLASGIEWQSSVELHLASKDKMNIIHNAVIRNNGEKFSAPEFYLVSGSPEIAMRNISSLLCFANSPKNFPPPASMKKSLMRNDFAVAESAAPAAFENFTQSGDILYRPLGKFAMEKGEARMVKLQSAENVPFRTAVKWSIAPLRNAYGRLANNNREQQPYNALIFKNLCPYMLDSAPLTVYSDGKLILQTSLDSNTPVNAERTVRLSAADGIECSIEENELVKQREQNIIINNRRYIRSTVEAVLKVKNLRKTAADIDLEYNFNGELQKCGIENFKVVSNSNTSSLLNPANTLAAEIKLQSGESKELKISYTILGTL